MGHSPCAEVLTSPPPNHVPPNQEHLGRMLTPLPSPAGGQLCKVLPSVPGGAHSWHITELFLACTGALGCGLTCQAQGVPTPVSM